MESVKEGQEKPRFSPPIGVRLPPRLLALLQEYLKRDCHLSAADFAREAIREKLRREAPELFDQLFKPSEG